MDFVLMAQQKYRGVFAKIVVCFQLALRTFIISEILSLNLNNCNNIITVNNYAIKPTPLMAIFKIGEKMNRMALMVKISLQICFSFIFGFYKFNHISTIPHFNEIVNSFLQRTSIGHDIKSSQFLSSCEKIKESMAALLNHCSGQCARNA